MKLASDRGRQRDFRNQHQRPATKRQCGLDRLQVDFCFSRSRDALQEKRLELRGGQRCVDAIVSDLLVRIEAMRRANGRDESSDRFERQSNQRFPSERASGGAGLGNTDLEIGDVVRAGMQFEIREQLTLVLRKLLFVSCDELDT
jgi:hypothetical protein